MSSARFLFALDPLKDEFVEPSDVGRGKGCACVCPSCKASVIAKKGDINRWHFSHDHRAHAQIEEECEYNLLLSVRLMARQIFSDEVEVCLPAYQGRISAQLPARAISVPYKVADAMRLRLKSPRINHKVDAESVDVSSDFGKYQMLIYFTHFGRPLPDAFRQVQNASYGLVCIDLGWMNALLERDDSQGISYKDLLRRTLLESPKHKQWIYHPRQERARQAAAEKLQAKVAIYSRGNEGKTKGRISISDAQLDAAVVAIKKV